MKNFSKKTPSVLSLTTPYTIFILFEETEYDFHIAFCCPVRNCGKYLSSIFKNIGLLKANPKYKISSVFAYDHCRDNSAELLLEYQKTDPHNIYVKNRHNRSPWSRQKYDSK